MQIVGGIVRNLRQARFDRMEISGSLGDLGTFLPLLLGLVYVSGLDFSAALFWGGLFNAATSLLFAIPMPVQPMKAIAAVGIGEHLSAPQVAAAGILAGAIVFILGWTRWIETIDRAVPRSVVRGIQLAVGLKLIIAGVEDLAGLPAWGADSMATGVLALALVLVLFNFHRIPAALLVFLLGLGLLALESPHLYTGLSLELYRPALVPIAPQDWLVGFLRGTVPQIPLTLLNSVVAVCALSADLFPDRRARPREVAVSVGVMNLAGCWFGAMPMCHGAGGLAGQARFGARTNGSILILGAAKMILALALGATLLPLVQAYPRSLLSVLLVMAGMELGSAARDQIRRQDFAVVLLTAGFAVATGSTAAGFAAGAVVAFGIRRHWFHLGGD